jgi:4-hydroxy-tetrahydrodipicolinate reductase
MMRADGAWDSDGLEWMLRVRGAREADGLQSVGVAGSDRDLLGVRRTMPIGIVIAGAAGRMGRRIVALAAADAELRVAAALEGPACPELGRDAGEVAGVSRLGAAIAAKLPEGATFDVLIDFSNSAATAGWLDVCAAAGRPMVIGTTGHDEATMARIKQAAGAIAVLKAANMSVGVNVLLRLAREAASLLDASYDVEIVESHHRFKLDAPSGTALALAEAVRRGRAGGKFGMHSLRIGDTVGEHAVQFGTLGETITLAHSAHSRDTFAAGALRAARWIVGRPPGLYDMQDVLFGVSR